MKHTPAPPAAGESWEKMLCARMVHNQAAREEEHDGTTRLKLPTRRPRWLVPPLSWIVRPPDHRTVTLDALGTEVWLLCDGRRTVEEVVERFAASNGLTFHEARVAATQYISLLVRQGALAVAM